MGDQLQALEDGLQDYSPTVKAAAGAIVTYRPQQAGRHSSRPDAQPKIRGQRHAHAGTPPRFRQ